MKFKTATEASAKGNPYYQQGYSQGYCDAEMKYLGLLAQKVLLEPHKIIVTTEQFEKFKKETANDDFA